MAGPLLRLVAAGIGAKLLLWNKRGAILNHVLRKQALSIVGQLHTDRLRLYRSHRKDIADNATAEVYRITCNGEDKFSPRYGFDMHLFAVAPEKLTPYIVAIPATLASEKSFVELHPVDILDAGYMGLMKAVRMEIDKMASETSPTVSEAEKAQEKPAKPMPETIGANSTENQDDLDTSPPAAAPTAGQVAVLKQAVETPGQILTGVSPQSIGACQRRGWIKLVGTKKDQLKNAKWRITDTGRAALIASGK